MSDIPYGYCHCGCGGLAPIATATKRSKGHVKGEPLRFILGHRTRLRRVEIPEPNPSGLCWCGCGERTALAAETKRSVPTVAGKPVRYIRNHHRRKSPVEYIEEDRGHGSPCWIWQRATNEHGYGSKRIAGREYRAHRVVYERERGDIPEGLELDHLCRVPACVNPDHLEPVTHAENIQRGYDARKAAA
jgi:hypothetical protein